jgi:uncharacterized protein (TIGR03000 family)
MIKRTLLAMLAAGFLLLTATSTVLAQGRLQEYGSPTYDYWWYNGPSYFDWHIYHSPRYSYIVSPYYGGWTPSQYHRYVISQPPVLRASRLVGTVAQALPSTSAALAAANQVRLIIRVPDPNARVWVEDQPTQQAGSERVLMSPPLNIGQHYYYTVRASWFENGAEVNRVKTVQVTPGTDAVVDFSYLGNELAPPPPQTRELRSTAKPLPVTSPQAEERAIERERRNPGFPFR